MKAVFYFETLNFGIKIIYPYFSVYESGKCSETVLKFRTGSRKTNFSL